MDNITLNGSTRVYYVVGDLICPRIDGHLSM